jgi:hypothetical protein
VTLTSKILGRFESWLLTAATVTACVSLRFTRQALRLLAVFYKNTCKYGGPVAVVENPASWLSTPSALRRAGYHFRHSDIIVTRLREAGYLQSRGCKGYLTTEKLETASLLDIMEVIGYGPKNCTKVIDRLDARLSQICDMVVESYRIMLTKFLVVNILPDLVEVPDVGATSYERELLRRALTGENCISDDDI